MSERPGRGVMREFDAVGALELLPGGQRPTWRCGDLVFKEADVDSHALEWISLMLFDIDPRGFRAAGPIRSSVSGDFIADGWTAWTFLPGIADSQRWPEILQVDHAIDEALKGVPAPDFLMARTDPWAVADRFTWGEESVDILENNPLLARIVGAMRPFSCDCQIVHGDLIGNVLFHPTLPPAVIDWSIYRRPRSYGSAVVVADRLLGSGMDDLIRSELAARVGLADLTLRALLFRLATDVMRGIPVDPSPVLALVDELVAVDRGLGRHRTD